VVGAAAGLYTSCVKWLHERAASILGSHVVQDVRPPQVEGVNQPILQIAPNINHNHLNSLCGDSALRFVDAKENALAFRRRLRREVCGRATRRCDTQSEVFAARL